MCVRCVFVCVCMTFNKRLIVYTRCKLNKDKSTFPRNFVCENKRYRLAHGNIVCYHISTSFSSVVGAIQDLHALHLIFVSGDIAQW